MLSTRSKQVKESMWLCWLSNFSRSITIYMFVIERPIKSFILPQKKMILVSQWQTCIRQSSSGLWETYCPSQVWCWRRCCCCSLASGRLSLWRSNPYPPPTSLFQPSSSCHINHEICQGISFSLFPCFPPSRPLYLIDEYYAMVQALLLHPLDNHDNWISTATDYGSNDR